MRSTATIASSREEARDKRDAAKGIIMIVTDPPPHRRSETAASRNWARANRVVWSTNESSRPWSSFLRFDCHILSSRRLRARTAQRKGRVAPTPQIATFSSIFPHFVVHQSTLCCHFQQPYSLATSCAAASTRDSPGTPSTRWRTSRSSRRQSPGGLRSSSPAAHS